MPSVARLASPLPALVAALLACGPRVASRDGAGAEIDPARARSEVEWLSHPAREGRGVGTAGGAAATAWIAERFREAGLSPAFDAGYLQTFEAPSRRTGGERGEAGGGRAETANVVAALPGSDPALAGECVVVGAHHDHLGRGGPGSLAPGEVGRIHPGADDNASGVAALLAIARAAAAQGPARRTVVFAAFGAEELGLLGSAHLVQNPPPGCPVGRMQLMVNLDTVGRPRAGIVYVDGAGSARGLGQLVEALVRAEPRLPLGVAHGDGGHGASDHTSFRARGVPALFLFTGAHADYHRPSDTADKVDAEGLAAVARLAARLVREAAEREGRLEPLRAASPAPPPERERGYGAYLGAVPDFAERSAPGVLLAGVRPGSPAERVGIAAGDVLLEVGGAGLTGLRDLAHALRSHRPGDTVELVWERAGRRMSGTVRLEERR